ncbi:MAG: exodeoxyribonuclease-3 [Maribacter sp.]|jgi:exodeoxyribonuclease-3
MKSQMLLSSLVGYQVNSNSADKKGYSGTAFLTKIPLLNIEDDMGITEHDTEGRV